MSGGSPAGARRGDAAGEVGSERGSILAVDDRRSNLVALEALLEPLGRRVVLAESGEQALRHLLVEDFALVLLDVQMPGMDGFETARFIRARPRTRNLPIIFVTAISTAYEHVFAGYEAGAVDYILKPIDPVVLRSKVRVFVELHEAHAQLRRQAELRAAHESLALAQRAGMSGIWDWDVASGRVHWSPEYAELCGLGEPGERRDGWLASVDPRDRERVTVRLDVLLERGEAWDEEYRIVHPVRGVRWIAARGRLYRSGAGAPERFTGLAVDVTDRKLAQARVARLHRATAALSAAATTAEVVSRILSEAPAATGAARASVWLSGEIETLPPALADPVRRALELGAPLSRHDRELLLPLTASGSPRGVLRLVYDRRPTLDDEARAFLEGLAAQCAQALERARLFDAEREARERTESLRRATAALTGAAGVTEVIEAAVGEALRHFDGVSAALRLAPPDGGLATVATAGPADPAIGPEERSAPDEASLTAHCARAGGPVAVLDGEAPPEGAGPIAGDGAVLAIPLRTTAEAIGVIAVRIAPGRGVTGADRDAMPTFGRLVTQALERARLDAERERERDRERVIAGASLALGSDLSLEQRLRALSESVVPLLADLCIVELVGEAGEIEVTAVRGPSPEVEASVRAVRTRHPLGPGVPEGVASVVVSGRPVLRRALGEAETEADIARAGIDGELAAAVRRRPARSLVIAPIHARGRNIGAISLIAVDDGRALDEEDLHLAVDLGGRAGLAIDNARLYEAQAGVALTLQRSLLPQELPRSAELSLAARYVSAAANTEAGGDWFDAIALPGERMLLCVGDVVGRGTEAAAVMGQLRSAMRAYATAGLAPGEMLEHLSRFAAGVPGAPGSTAACVEIDLLAGRMRYARAGHPPPLLVHDDGRAEYLPQVAPGTVLGFGFEDGHGEMSVDLPRGAALVLYTDGAIERRGEHLGQGLDRLARIAAACWPATAYRLCERMLDRVLPSDDSGDDVALLVARREPSAPPLTMSAPARPEGLAGVRRAMRAWLADLPLPEADRQDILLACGEACANSAEHGCGGRDDGTLSLACTWSADGELDLLVEDDGGWKEGHGLPGRGRGMPIMRAVMDTVEIDAGDDGTRVRMRRRTPRLDNVVLLAAASAGAAAPSAGAATFHLDPDGGRGALSGEIDAASLLGLRASLEAAAREERLTLDLSQVGYIDSAGVGLVWDLAARLDRRGGRLTLVAPPGTRVRRVLDLSGLAGADMVDEAAPAAR